MTITSINFFIIVFFTSVLYYVIPCKVRWIYLLGVSIVIYCMISNPWTILYVIGSAMIVYIATVNMEKSKYGKLMTYVAMAIIFSLLALMKYVDFFVYNANALIPGQYELTVRNVMASLGVSYYTLSLAGYLLDVRWKIVAAERNFFKVLLFTCFFPKMVMGPISKWEEFNSNLENDACFSISKYTDATVRVLYGAFMKIVVAGRIAAIVDTIFADYSSMNGLFLAGGMILYTFRLFCDFAGGIHIIMGISALFGINLPENFRNPFFSRSVQEWWQRWHITLGRWTKEYILYPVLRSKRLVSVRDKLQSILGKKAAKKIVTYIGMLCVWLYIGLWHGGAWKFFALGVYFWIIICIENEIGGSKRNNISTIRTIVLAAVGNLVFLCRNLQECIHVICYMGRNVFSHLSNSVNLVRETGYVTGLDGVILLLCVLLVISVEYIEWKQDIFIISWYHRRCVVIRWGIIYFLILVTIIWGIYGEGYDASTFIYQEF